MSILQVIEKIAETDTVTPLIETMKEENEKSRQHERELTTMLLQSLQRPVTPQYPQYPPQTQFPQYSPPQSSVPWFNPVSSPQRYHQPSRYESPSPPTTGMGPYMSQLRDASEDCTDTDK